MKPPTTAGISLLEVLIALVLMAAIAGALASTMQLGSLYYARTASLSEELPEIAARIRLRNWATFALPPSRLTTFPASFVGTPNGFVFTTLSATRFAPEAAALRVSVSVEADQINLTATSVDQDGNELDVHSAILAERADDIRLTYFDAKSDPPAWTPEWSNTLRLPDLIRIEVARGSQPDWPVFIVRPVLDQ